MIKYIFRNSSYLLVSQMLVKVFAFGYTIFLAGNIGASDFGTYSAGLSIFGLMSLLADLGINRVLTRDIARDEANFPKLFSTALLLRALFASVSFLILTIFFYLNDASNLRFILTSIALLSLIPQSIALSIDAVLIATKRVYLSALGFFLFNMISFIIGALFIFFGFGVYGAIIAFLIGHIFYSIFFVLILIISKQINFSPFDAEMAKKILVKSLPYGILSAIGFASFRLDTVVLSYTRSGIETGVYSLAYRFLEAATIVPIAFGTILYPVFSEIGSDLDKTRKLFRTSLAYGFLAGVVVTASFFTVLPWFMDKFFPESFLGASDALKILSLALPFIFMHIPLGQLILTKEKLLGQIILLYLGIFFLNLAFMLYFLPQFGYIAAAWITVFAEMITFLTFIIFIKVKRLA